MSEEYYEEEYEGYSDEQYEDAYHEGYEDGREEGLDDIGEYQDSEYDCMDNVEYDHDCQNENDDSRSRDNHTPHIAHTMLGAAMGYAAAKSFRGKIKPQSLKEKLDSLNEMERALVSRRVQEKMQREDKQSGFWVCLFIGIIIVLCLVCC